MSVRASLAIAATALALTAAPSHAAPPNDAEYLGGCDIVAVTDTGQALTDIDEYEAVVVAAIVPYAPTLGHNLVGLTSSCYVTVNGVEIHRHTPSSSGYFAYDVRRIAPFYASPSSVINVCTVVDTRDAHNQTKHWDSCESTTDTTAPSENLSDLVCLADDPIVCTIARSNGVVVRTSVGND